MRVALAIHHVRPTGGQDRYALELARRLAARCELELVVISAQGSPLPDVPIHIIAAPGRPLLLAAPLFQWRASAVVRAGHYDVVHGVGGALPGASVVTAQFCAAEWREVNRGAPAYQRFVAAQAVRDERRTYTHPELRAVVAVSRRTADEIHKHYGPLRVPVTVVPNGVDLRVFAPRPPARHAGRPRLLLVGAYERKGLGTAIRALALMKTDAELLAVGAGDQARHLALAAELRVADRVRLEPPRDRIEEAFAQADAFVLPTRYEPFGMVIAEALASGVPVVASAVAGAAELIRDGESGFVVADAEDAAGFARALDAVLAADREAMARAARAAVAGLSWDVIAERTFDVYRTAAS